MIRAVNFTRARAHRPTILVAIAAAVMVASLAAALAIEQQLREAGRADLIVDGAALVTAFVIATAAATVVGGRLAIRRPAHPAGWLFLAVALSLSASALAQSYAAYGAVHDPGSLPGARMAAVHADGSFLAWISLFAIILLVTPTGSAPGRRWKLVGWVAAVSEVVFLVAISFRARPIDSPPFEGMTGPFAGNPLGDVFTAIASVALVTAHLALLAAVISVVIRAIRSKGEARRQLRWLVVPAIPFPFLVAGAWLAARAGNQELLGLFGGGFLAIVPVAAGLAIEKTSLYDIDRIISRTVAYTLLSALVLGSYLAAVAFAGLAGGRAGAESVPAAVAATLAAVAVGGFARRKLQDAVDKRFNRRSFAALEQVRRYVRQPAAGVTIEQALRTATGDPGISIAYWSDDRSAWVAEDGTLASPGAGAFELRTATGSPAAAIRFDEARVGRTLIEALAAEARAEIENARLRAAINLQLVEVRESRARIVSAQLAERKRIERDLHDGSQQRLLALAMNLRATELSGDAAAALKALPRAVDEIQATVRELRELANGLYPAALEDGGLSAAFHELASRGPIPIRVSVLEKRLPAAVESSAWFIACEAIANVVKHAAASVVSLQAAEEGGMLVLSIDDDGVGGADSLGHGLRGMADRAETAGGQFSVGSSALGGTSIRAVLPCES